MAALRAAQPQYRTAGEIAEALEELAEDLDAMAGRARTLAKAARALH